MKKLFPFLFLVLALFVAYLVFGEDVTVPTSASTALGLPSSAPVVTAPNPRFEIENNWATGHKKQAQKRLDRWISEDKNSPWPWVVSARMQCEMKKYKKCVSLAEVALAKSPDCAEAYYWKGRGLEGQGKNLDAANEYRAALTTKNKFLEAQKDLDRVSNLLGL